MFIEISVEQLSEKIQSGDAFLVLDVRELYELERAKITDARLVVVPMSRLGQEGTGALPQAAQEKDALLYVLCHHGSRSMQVARWLRKQGWTNAFSVRGGIAEYAARVDESVGFY